MNIYDLCIGGFGVVGSEALDALTRYEIKYKNKKIRIAIAERDLDNIPGGVAYSLSKSKFGFFNNPIRLSHPEFIKWIKNKKNFGRLSKFIKKSNEYDLDEWLKYNKKLYNSGKKKAEIYLPRFIYAFYLQEKIIDALINLKKKNYEIDFFEGEIVDIKKKSYICIKGNNHFKNFTLVPKLKKLTKIKKKNFKTEILCKNLVISNGILPPSKIPTKNNSKNKNYIWDFYTEGGTENLINKIKILSKNKKKIVLVFIGNKAGLLETMQSLEKIIKKKRVDLKIISISTSDLSLQKAELSSNHSSFNFKFLKIKNKIKIQKSEEIYNLIKLEFENAISRGFNKYDVWTKILERNILSYFYNQLTSKEKKKYNAVIFNKIRKITRYTYPETVAAKDNLEKFGKLKFINDRVIKINKNVSTIDLITKNRLKINCDILINVSGPMNIVKNKNEVKFINSLKKLSKKFKERGFYVNNHFELSKNIYLPGTLSYNFNPLRETIIKAITNNTHKAVKDVIKKINYGKN